MTLHPHCPFDLQQRVYPMMHVFVHAEATQPPAPALPPELVPPAPPLPLTPPVPAIGVHPLPDFM
jgi:hypothetical protein